MKYADVIVNKTKIYTYTLPEDLQATVGSKVIVSIRGKQTEGFIVNFTSEPDFKSLPIIKIVDEHQYFTPELVALAEWMSQYYKSYFHTALKAILP